MRQHLDQSRIIGDVGAGTVGEERKAQRIHCQMSFNAIGQFVEAKTFRLVTCIAGVLYRL